MNVQLQPLTGQVALVTGASRGIGRAICIEFARAGADIVLVSRSTEAQPSKVPGTIEQTAHEVEALGRRTLCIGTDVSNEEQVEAMGRRALEEFVHVDILVNNAAYLFPAPFHQTPLRRWDRVMTVNVRGPVMCIQQFLPGMIKRGHGRVLNITSGSAAMEASHFMQQGKAGDRPLDTHSVELTYAVSKAALEKLSQALGGELAQFGIQVNALRPGGVASEGAMYLNPGIDYSGMRKPSEPAKAALWIVTQPPSVTGRIFDIREIEEMTPLA